MYCYTGLALPSLQLLAHGLASTDSFAFVLTQSCPVAGARVNKVAAYKSNNKTGNAHPSSGCQAFDCTSAT